MSDVLVVPSCCNRPLLCNGFKHGGGEWKQLKVIATNYWQCRTRWTTEIKLKPMMIVRGKMVNPSTYTSRMSTDKPLHEVAWASFDQYLEDKPRVFKAMFPEKQRSKQLNEWEFRGVCDCYFANPWMKAVLLYKEEWRIHMLPIDFLFLTVRPVVDIRLRCKSQGLDYPPDVPLNITRVIELDIIRWKLDGLDDVFKPSHFYLGVKGVLYPLRRGTRSRLIGRLQMSISFELPAILSLVPEDVRREVAEQVLKRLVDNMKNKVNSSLLADYSNFKRERSVEIV